MFWEWSFIPISHCGAPWGTARRLQGQCARAVDGQLTGRSPGCMGRDGFPLKPPTVRPTEALTATTSPLASAKGTLVPAKPPEHIVGQHRTSRFSPLVLHRPLILVLLCITSSGFAQMHTTLLLSAGTDTHVVIVEGRLSRRGKDAGPFPKWHSSTPTPTRHHPASQRGPELAFMA